MDDILSSITGDVPQETTNCCRIFICWMFVLWLPGPFYDCSGIGFHQFRLSVSVAKTCTFPVILSFITMLICTLYGGATFDGLYFRSIYPETATFNLCASARRYGWNYIE